MKLGAFSISLGVKDLQASKAFYTKLGFSQFGGTDEHHYAIMKNGDTLVAMEQEQGEAEGPASFVVIDPDGNPILIDQHR